MGSDPQSAGRANHLGTSLCRPASRRQEVVVPVLLDSEFVAVPIWEQNAMSASAAIDSTGFAKPCILVGHSGAGPLLPAIGERMKTPPAGFIFVDAGLPANHSSRLDMMKTEPSQWAQEFDQYLAGGGLFPDWSDSDLHDIIPEDVLRQQVLAELRPRGQSFFTEQLSFSDRWSKAACGYLLFSPAYNEHARQARQLGWPFIHLPGGHFHMLVEPEQVADALVQIARQMLPAA